MLTRAVFSKCADSIQNGQRLEYMCWRYWNRATIRPEPELAAAPSTTEKPKDIPSTTTTTTTSVPDLPQLSKSVDSETDEDTVESAAEADPVDIRPRILRQDSCASRRDRSPRSDDFEKLFVSILKEDEPLLAAPATQPSSPMQRSGSTTTEESTNSADTSEESQPSPDMPSTTVIRGFSPATITVEQPSSASVSSPAAEQQQQLPSPAQKQQKSGFVCGASASSSDQLSLPPKRPAPKPKQPVFQLGTSGSSQDDGSLRENMRKSRSVTFLPQRRQPTLPPQHVMNASESAMDSAIASDSETEGDDFDESAIDDDEDDSDWEDSDEVSGKSSIDDKAYFRRVDSSANLVSRRSLLTLGLEANERQRRLGNITSHSTSALHRNRTPQGPQGIREEHQQQQQQQPQPAVGSPNDSDEAPLMMKTRPQQLKPIREAPRTAAQPISAHAGAPAHFQAALSPRTTRRHMLATELTESLRRHLLWERQQKTSTANAVLKRRHTSHDVANLQQYPERAYMDRSEDENAGSWNQYFAREASNGYHSKGW